MVHILKFDQGITHDIPNEWLLVAMAMNADEKTVCLLVYQNEAPQNLKIFVIFDWDMRSYALLDTGLFIVSDILLAPWAVPYSPSPFFR